MPKILCPNCRSKDTCSIVYGFIDLKLEPDQDSEVDDTYYGGCVIEDNSPDRHCNNCKRDFVAGLK